MDKTTSLFMVSKLDNDDIIKKINFDNPDFNFYKNRDILFFICIFLKYLITNHSHIKCENNDYDIEKNFINHLISEDLVKKYIDVINKFGTEKNLLDLYKNKSFFKKKLRKSTKKTKNSKINIKNI